MGKRSNFERVPRDYYPTPESAVLPLLHHLQAGTLFIEPCAGDGRLIDHLAAHGHHCVDSFDIEPRSPRVRRGDATGATPNFTDEGLRFAAFDAFITNPPWERAVLHAIISHLAAIRPTWLLFDADWMHTKQAAPYVPWLRKIVSVGRVKWIEDSPFTGKDNCCWHLFDAWSRAPAMFVGRAA